MTTTIPSLQECFDRHAQHGACDCHYKEWVQPYNCDIEILACKICTKEYGRRPKIDT